MTTTLITPILTSAKIEIILRGSYKQAPGYVVAKLSEISHAGGSAAETYANSFEFLVSALPGKMEADVVSKQIAASI